MAVPQRMMLETLSASTWLSSPQLNKRGEDRIAVCSCVGLGTFWVSPWLVANLPHLRRDLPGDKAQPLARRTHCFFPLPFFGIQPAFVDAVGKLRLLQK